MSLTRSPDPDAGRFTVDVKSLVDGRAPAEQREEEWVRVFRHFQPRLQGYFRSRTASAETLDDLLAELWRRAVLGVASLRSGAAMWSWLTTIGNNLLRDQWRRDRRVQVREVSWTDAEADDRLRHLLEGWVVPDEAQSSPDGPRSLVLEALTPDDRALLTLFADGFTHEEIAVELGLTGAAASRQRLRRLRLRFAGSPTDADGVRE
jgi:RNA polymerase sigma factor (sigma-70 family)